MDLTQIQVYYKILDVNHNDNSIVVRYYTDFMTEDELTSMAPDDNQKREDGSPLRCRTDYNLNIWDHMNTEEDVHKHILQCAPVEWFKMQQKIKTGNKNPVFDIIHGIKNQVFNKPVVTDVLKSEKLLTDTEIDDLIVQLSNK